VSHLPSLGEEACLDQEVAMVEAKRRIDLEYVDRHATDCRSPNKLAFVPMKVIRPASAPRIKKRHGLSRKSIKSGNVRTLVLVAGEARQSEVLKRGCSAMLQTDHMVNLERP
jgi:hypothetical protein